MSVEYFMSYCADENFLELFNTSLFLNQVY